MPAKIDILLELIETWTTSKDIDKVLTYLTDDIVWHYAAAIQPPKVGHAGAREFLEPFARRVKNPSWQVFDHAERGDTLFVEGIDGFETRDGVKVIIPYMGVYKFRGDKICGWRDYFDQGVADRGVRGEPLPDYTRDLTDRPAVRPVKA